MVGIRLSHITAGFIAVLVGYTSSAAIIFQAAQAAGASAAETSSWMWALGIGMGAGSILLSAWKRQPILVAWSTPGAALLATSLPGVSMPEAVGIFLFCAGLLTLTGLTGLFDRIVNLIPKEIAAAMLAGLLIRFAFDIFPAFADSSLLAGVMCAVYLIGKWRGSIYTIPMVLLAGILVATLEGSWQTDSSILSLAPAVPVFTMPIFDPALLIGVGIPLYVVTMASQNLPGIATLRAHDYDAPASPMISVTGILSLVLAPFGGFAFNLAAITAAICMGDDVDPDKDARWKAGIFNGIFALVAGIFGATIAGLFIVFPGALVSVIAGLALLGTIHGALRTALVQGNKKNEAALITFILAASGGTFLTISAPFWGLVAGMVTWSFMRHR